jgi:hexosaminidase
MQARRTRLPAFLYTAAALALAACSADSSRESAAHAALAAANVIPAPREITTGEGAFALTPDVAVVAAEDAAATARYFVELLSRTGGPSLQMSAAPGAGGAIQFELTARESASNVEGYSLSVSPERIVVSASDSRGLFYGAVTLWQLSTAQAGADVRIPALTIVDEPRFRWRGLMLDSARHYQSPEFIRKLIDVMALHKLNTLHWHLVDDQAWRLEIRKYPKLTSVGAWRVPAGAAPAADIDPATGKPRLYGGFYTQEQVRELVAYARTRHITIVPEIEMPGHASAAVAAYPQLGVAGNAVLTSDGVHPPADWGVYPSIFNVDDATFAFLEDVLSETLELFPSEYIHVGGDEAVKDQWRASPAVQQRMRELGVKDEHALQSWFIQRMEKFLSARGRRLIGWDEILEGGLAPNATVMSWRGVDGAIAAAAAGHDAVLSPHPVLYFDNRPLDVPAPPGRGRIVSVEDVYKFEAAPAALTEAQRKHILGVQANVWTEHIRTEDRVEFMMFPRAAALSEVAWSPVERIDWASFSARLPTQLERYDRLQVRRSPLGIEAAAIAENGLRTSHALKLCSENIALSLEDDGPVQGERAVFLVDILDPCWIYPQADLSRATSLKASVGQAPFNFQIGEDVKKIPLRAPATPAGELEVRLDHCEGEKIAVLPLAPAAASHAVTQLPPASLPVRAGKHDLCLTFTRASVDPMWLVHTIELGPTS